MPGQALAFRRMNSALRVTLHLRVRNRLEQILPPSKNLRIRKPGWNGCEATARLSKQEKAAVCSRTLSIRPSRCEPLNLDGDGQADLTVHGGASKAVLCVPRLTTTTIGEQSCLESNYHGYVQRKFHD